MKNTELFTGMLHKYSITTFNREDFLEVKYLNNPIWALLLMSLSFGHLSRYQI